MWFNWGSIEILNEDSYNKHEITNLNNCRNLSKRCEQKEKIINILFQVGSVSEFNQEYIIY